MKDLINLLDKIGPLFYVIIPTAFGIYLNVRDRLIAKKSEVLKANLEKSKEKYSIWEHEESQWVIKKIKDMCDYYKDKGHMDLVEYIQLENGTASLSNLCNMFVSCLAEDSRYGNLPKLITKLQRVPYSRVACWIDHVRKLDNDNYNTAWYVEDTSITDCPIREIIETDLVKSTMSVPIYNPNERLLGMCVFYYSEKSFNGRSLSSQVDLINRFRTGIETIFINYEIARNAKMKELGLPGGEDNV